MLNFTNKYLFAVCLTFLTIGFFAFVPVHGHGQEETSAAPEIKIEIRDVEIQKKDTEITVSATLFNPSGNIETPPFTYLIMLENSELLSPLIEEPNDLETSIVSADEGRSYITLKPMEKRKVNYRLEISPYLPKTLYVLRLGVIKSDGSLLGKFSQLLSDIDSNALTGDFYEKPFFVIDQENCYVINSEGKKYLKSSGAVFEPGASPRIGCEVTNISGETASAVPVVSWKEFFVYGRPDDGKLEKNNYNSVSFMPGESKTVEILLPEITKPQVYQAMLGFVDQNNQAVSFLTSFRWTVKGSSARIEEVSLAGFLKPSYKKGETMSLSVDYFGSMDLYWQGIDSDVKKLEDVKLEAIITDSSGLECGRKTASVENVEDSLLKNALIDVVLEKKCDNPRYVVSVSSEGEKLNEQTGAFPNMIKKTRWFAYGLLGVMSLAVLAFFVFLKRKKKNAGNALVLILAMSSIFFFGFAADSLASTADTEVTTTSGNIKTKTYTGNAFGSPNMGGGAFNNDTSKSDKLKSYYWDGQLSNGFNTARMGFMQLALYDFDREKDGWLNFELEGKHEFACSNESAKFKIWVTSRDGNTGSEGGVLQIKGQNQTKYQEKITGTFGDKYYSSWGKDLDVKFNDLYNAFYDSAGKLKTKSPQIVFYLQQVGRNHSGANTPYFIGFFGNAADRTGSGNTNLTSNEAWEKGDILRVIIPIGNLPDPSADLSGTSPIDYNCKPALTWTVNDIDSCSASGGWSGSKTATDGTYSETMASGITTATTYGLSCSAINKTYSDSVTVDVKNKPTVDVKVYDKDTKGWTNGPITLSSGDSASLSWSREQDAGTVSCETNDWDGDLKKETYSGNGGTVVVKNITATKTYTMDCENSCNYLTSDGVTINVAVPPTTNGECAVTSGTYSSEPSGSDACKAGTYIYDSPENTTDYWKWTCNGSNGGSNDATCSAKKSTTPTNGECAVTSGTYSSEPSGSDACKAGTYIYDSPENTTDYWKWTCDGSNGGSDDNSCSAKKSVIGDPVSYSLTINIQGNCSGNIYNKEKGDSTASTKTYTGYSSGDSVTLTATNGAYSGQTCKMTGGWNTASGGNCVGGTLRENNSPDDTCGFTMTGDRSLTASFDTSGSVPGIPTGLSGSAGACGGNTNLSWNSVSDATSYTLYRSGNIFSGITGTSYSDSGLGNNTEYEYKVKACNTTGCSPDYSPSVYVTSSSACEADWYSLTFKTKGNGSGYAIRNVLINWSIREACYDENVWNCNWDESIKMYNNDQASIGRVYWFRLKAIPDADSYLSSWSGCDSSDSDYCYLKENPSGTSKTVTAVFNSSSGGAVSCDPKVELSTRRETENWPTIYWYSAYADSCVPSDGGYDMNWKNSSIGTSGTYSGPELNKLESSRTYTVTCSNSSGMSSSKSVTNTPSNKSNPAYFSVFEAVPNPVTSGKSTTLYWLGTNCYAGEAKLFSPSDSSIGTFYNQSWAINTFKQWFGSIANNGGYYKGLPSANYNGYTTGNLSSDTQYAISCNSVSSSGGGRAINYLTVTAGVDACGPSNLPPEVSLACDPSSCEGYVNTAAGGDGSLKITYSATDANDDIESCEFEVNGKVESSSCSGNYYPTSVLGVGTHIVAMTAVDSEGSAGSGSKNIKILEDIKVDFDCSMDGVSYADCSTVSPKTNAIVYLRDKSEPSSGKTLSSWQWTFNGGNPSSSTVQNPQTAFTSSGSKDVTLKITDSAGRTKSKTVTIQAGGRLAPTWKEVAPK